jgi:pimeloyl-ACP methyl ester carboxylesterase
MPRLSKPLFCGLLCLQLGTSAALAEGEAGILSLRGQGHYYVGIETSEPAENGSVQIHNQMFVGFQLPAEKKFNYPLILVHGGGGQSTDWFSTPDGRDGWRDYFVAAGFDVYWVDRPGFGRSPTSGQYGELGNDANSAIITLMAESENWPGNAKDQRDPTILALLASAPPGPYAGNLVAARNLAELLDRTGPAIIITHGAGGVSGWWAADMKPDKVAGIIAIEASGSNPLSRVRRSLSFEPELPQDFRPTRDDAECDMQPADKVSILKHLKGKQVFLVASEFGLKAGQECAAKALRQAGVNAEYVYLPDHGFKGNGHFMMAETNNGEVAGLIMKLAEKISQQ